MPKTPKGHKRPAVVVSNAVRVMKIATGEIQESEATQDGRSKAAVELGRRGGLARAKAVSKAQRAEIARRAAKARWAAKKR
jgi:2-keto-3-deoxy-6-phosphogluconate aldolase